MICWKTIESDRFYQEKFIKTPEIFSLGKLRSLLYLRYALILLFFPQHLRRHEKWQRIKILFWIGHRIYTTGFTEVCNDGGGGWEKLLGFHLWQSLKFILFTFLKNSTFHFGFSFISRQKSHNASYGNGKRIWFVLKMTNFIFRNSIKTNALKLIKRKALRGWRSNGRKTHKSIRTWLKKHVALAI